MFENCNFLNKMDIKIRQEFLENFYQEYLNCSNYYQQIENLKERIIGYSLELETFAIDFLNYFLKKETEQMRYISYSLEEYKNINIFLNGRVAEITEVGRLKNHDKVFFTKKDYETIIDNTLQKNRREVVKNHLQKILEQNFPLSKNSKEDFAMIAYATFLVLFGNDCDIVMNLEALRRIILKIKNSLLNNKIIDQSSFIITQEVEGGGGKGYAFEEGLAKSLQNIFKLESIAWNTELETLNGFGVAENFLTSLFLISEAHMGKVFRDSIIRLKKITRSETLNIDQKNKNIQKIRPTGALVILTNDLVETFSSYLDSSIQIIKASSINLRQNPEYLKKYNFCDGRRTLDFAKNLNLDEQKVKDFLFLLLLYTVPSSPYVINNIEENIDTEKMNSLIMFLKMSKNIKIIEDLFIFYYGNTSKELGEELITNNENVLEYMTDVSDKELFLNPLSLDYWNKKRSYYYAKYQRDKNNAIIFKNSFNSLFTLGKLLNNNLNILKNKKYFDLKIKKLNFYEFLVECNNLIYLQNNAKNKNKKKEGLDSEEHVIESLKEIGLNVPQITFVYNFKKDSAELNEENCLLLYLKKWLQDNPIEIYYGEKNE